MAIYSGCLIGVKYFLDIELLNERLKTLTTQLQDAQNRIEQGMADMNALDGAIQEVNYWRNIILESQNQEI